MQDAADKHENVKDRMVVPNAFQREKDHSQCIREAAGDYERDRGRADGFEQRLYRKNPDPAHHDVR